MDILLSSFQVLQLGMNFLTAEDMIAILAVKLRKRLGFGMWTKMHLTGMHIEGKVFTHASVMISSLSSCNLPNSIFVYQAIVVF